LPVGALFVALALMFNEQVPGFKDFIFGGAAGIFGSLGLVFLYSGLARGNMGVVAPMSAVIGAVLPILASSVKEGLPGTSQMIGFGLALLAAWILSSTEDDSTLRLKELYLPLMAGMGFGLFFILIDQADSGAVFWPLIAARCTSVTFLFFVLLFKNKEIRVHGNGPAVLIILSGIFDAGGNAFFVQAAILGRLDISAVLSSLYPAATVLLAWVILKERLEKRQWVGILAALIALILISV
jgi:drug/metabolite transporter (DMT)-like permease